MEPSPPSPADDSTRLHGAGRSWTLPIVLGLALLVPTALLVIFRTAEPPTAAFNNAAMHQAWSPAPRPEGETVALTIDFGNGARREFAALPWSEGMTVGDLLRQARSFRPPVDFTRQGAGEAAFLTSLEGVANDGARGRYWTYHVNDRRGEVGFDVQPLAAGDRVLWEFVSAE